jgi:predicted transposase YbfD/YdcC
VPPIKRTPVRIEILSSAENTSVLHNDLNDILVDASGCEYLGYVDKDGNTRVKIELTVSEDEKQHAWHQLRLKHAADCYISVEPTGLSMEPILIA